MPPAAPTGPTRCPAIVRQPHLGLIDKFGLNYSRFFITPGLTISMYVLNSSGPLFRNNPQLRRAVNLAVNRAPLVALGAGDATDQYLPPNVLGFKRRTIYPARDRRPRTGAGGRESPRRQGPALRSRLLAAARSAAQAIQLQLSELGLEIEIRPFAEHATSSAYLGRLGNADEPWDLALVLWTPDFVDPAAYVNRLLDGQHAGGTNLARFDEPPYSAAMQQASRLRGAARAQGLRRARPATRPRRRAAPADRSPQRGDARLGTGRLHVAAARASCSPRSA